MDTDELYLVLEDKVYEELNKYHFESREELHEKIVGIIESIFTEIEENYANVNGIEWEE